MVDGPVTMFSPHARLLAQIRRDPNVRMRDLALTLDMTERNVQNLLRDLQQGGLLEVERRGRRNRYRLNTRRRVGQEMGLSISLGRLLQRIGDSPEPDAPPEAPRPAKPRGKAAPEPDSKPKSKPVEAPRDGSEDASDGQQLDWLGSA